jgi:hypothetical protein
MLGKLSDTFTFRSELLALESYQGATVGIRRFYRLARAG